MSYEFASLHDKDTVLHEAAFQGDIKTLKSELRSLNGSKKLLNCINSRNRLGCTPLRLAATAGHSECVHLLLSNGAQVDIADIKAQTPLFVAVKNRHIDCARALLEAGAHPDGNRHSLCSPIYIAAMDGFLEGIAELLRFDSNPDISRFCIGYFDSTPVYIAIAYHHFECCRLLLLRGADPCAGPGVRSTTVASFSASASRSSTSSSNCPSLYHAAVKHNVEVEYVALLFDCGASLYQRDSHGRLAYEIDKSNDCSKFIQQLIHDPRSLLSACRIVIRRCLGRRRLKFIENLELPLSLFKYISHTS